MSDTSPLSDESLPGVWRDADSESQRGQRLTLVLTVSTVAGALLAAVGGLLSVDAALGDLGPWVALVGFLATLVSGVASWAIKPEATWYNGRAVAESAKTLAWRYAVGADPFPLSMSNEQARSEFRRRMSRVADDVAGEIVFQRKDAITTPVMDALRLAPFEQRRTAYVAGRTNVQQAWYAEKARINRRRARQWRFALALLELAAVGLALSAVFSDWEVGVAGLLAVGVTGGASWVAVRQFSPLAAAYALAAKELAFQSDKLQTVPEEEWSLVAADAEEAISREHTTWAASRIGRLRAH